MANLPNDTYDALNTLAIDIQNSRKKCSVIYAHNGIGKTSLSVAFKNVEKKASKGKRRNTLYYNAFTEDLFYWDNDLINDEKRILIFKRESRFFEGINANEMETRIRNILSRYSDFDFSIKLDEERTKEDGSKYTINYITFKRMVYNEAENISDWQDNVKISRGEENIFKWCFFLTIMQMAIDGSEAYNWVKYIFIDDPISSLDDNNAILVANHLASLIRSIKQDTIYTVISTHHGLFYNVICNELKQAAKYYLHKEELDKDDVTEQTKYVWKVKDLENTPFFHHVAIIKELNKAVEPTGKLYTYHFNMLRNVLEKTASFHGYKKFGDCIKKFEDDPDEVLYSRMINIMSHGDYSLFEPVEMNEENKKYFKQIYSDFKKQFPFNENI